MITGVALYHKPSKIVVSLPKPNRHNNIIEALYDITGKQISNRLWAQGFITDDGKFLNRQEAAKYVIAVGQPLMPDTIVEYIRTPLTTLFSEDLW